AKKRPKGLVEKRGNSFRVKVYAGIDPLTGRRLYLSADLPVRPKDRIPRADGVPISENTPHDWEQVTVPAEIVRAACKRWPDRGPRWASSVNAGLDELCRRYRVQALKVMDARYRFVVSVRAAGERLNGVEVHARSVRCPVRPTLPSGSPS